MIQAPVILLIRKRTLGSGQGSNVSGLGTDIVDDGGLKPGNNEMGSFVVDLLLDTKNTRVLDSAVTSVDYVGEYKRK